MTAVQTRDRGGERRAVARRVVGRVLLPGAVIYALLVGTGLLLAHPLAGFAGREDVIDRDLVGVRSPGWNTVTHIFSELANTPAIVAMVIVCALVVRWLFKRWTESIILVGAVWLQATVFLLTTLVVDRQRPDVPELDQAPPTSSFPSGHTGAATALFCGLALVVAWRLRHPILRPLLVGVLVVMPFAVAMSRLYRGMHHPTDVLFGALNGLACLLVIVLAVRTRRHTRDG
jgi:undecaprenyl-diphosphatase